MDKAEARLKAKQRSVYYPSMPNKKAADAAMTDLDALGFYCHTLMRSGRTWEFLAEKPATTGKIDRNETMLVKSIVVEKYGGDLRGWKLAGPVELYHRCDT